MSSLFDSTPPPPLAEALRPKTIEEVIGQTHLLASGKPLNLAFASGKPHSMILWGPPGVGKTTLARLSAKAFDREFIAISAVLAGVKEIREAIEQAQRRDGGDQHAPNVQTRTFPVGRQATRCGGGHITTRHPYGGQSQRHDHEKDGAPAKPVDQ